MAEPSSSIPDVSQEDIEKAIEEVEFTGRKHGPRLAMIVSGIAALWSLFQLWIASPLPFIFDLFIIVDVPARGIHLAFGLLLCFLMFPAARVANGLTYIYSRWENAGFVVLPEEVAVVRDQTR